MHNYDSALHCLVIRCRSRPPSFVFSQKDNVIRVIIRRMTKNLPSPMGIQYGHSNIGDYMSFDKAYSLDLV